MANTLWPVSAVSGATNVQEHESAVSGLWKLAYDELRELARRRLGRESPGQTLQPTALVNEAYLRLRDGGIGWEGRGHFFAAAANAMRRVLVDRARSRAALKRGGPLARVPLSRVSAVAIDSANRVIEVNSVLQKLEAIDAHKAALVTLRYFLGYSIEETARVLGVSPAKVKQDWVFARAWLRRELCGA